MPVSRSLLQAINPLAELAIISVENAPHLRELAQVQMGNSQPFRMLAFSPLGSMLAGSTLDSVSVWDINHQQRIVERRTTALHLLYSPDGRSLVTVGKDIDFLDAQTLEPKASLKGHTGGTTNAAFSPDGSLLASGGMDGVVRIGSLSSRTLVRAFQHPSPVRGLAFAPDGETIASVSWGDSHSPRMLFLWSIRTGKQVAAVKCSTEKNLSFSSDGRFLAVDGTIYDASTMQIMHTFSDRVAAFSPNGRLIATCRSDFNTIGIWDAITGDKLAVLKGHSEGIWHVAFNSAGTLLASSSGKLDMHTVLGGESDQPAGDRSVRLWGVTLKDPDATKPLKPVTKTLKRLG